MKIMRIVAVGITAMLTASGFAAPAQAATPGTVDNAITAAHDEAEAYASYRAWAAQADTVPNHTIAVLLGIVAEQERGEHFAELAELAGLVDSSLRNLTVVIDGERSEATSIYPGFRHQALADGDLVTAALFGELASDEATHQDVLSRAVRALCGHGATPVAPAVDPVPIVQQPAQAHGQTLINVRAAMRGEAYAAARYELFADRAYAEGRPWLGRLFTTLAAVETNEHYAALANRAGLVGPLGVNLAAAVAAEVGAIASYDAFAAAAATAGDTDAAALFAEIGSDESAHRTLFQSAG